MPPARFGCNPMDNHGQRVHGLCIHEDVHLDQITLTHTDLVIIEAGITPADGFQPIVKIEHDFIEWQLISDLFSAAHLSAIILYAARKSVVSGKWGCVRL